MPIFISQDVDEVIKEPLIGWHDLLHTGSVANIDAPSDAPRRNALNGLTYNYWRLGPDTQTLQVSLGSSQPVDYVGIAAHTLGSTGRRVRVQRGTSNAHSEAWFAPSTDAPLMIYFPQASGASWRVQVEAGPEAYIGVVYLGRALRMKRRIFRGFTPPAMGRVTDIRPQQSVDGQFLGRSIETLGVATTFQFNNLPGDWYRQEFEPFVVSAIRRPFFVAWRPDDYPEDCAFVWTEGDIQPENSGPGDFMSVSFGVRGIAT